ncbi:MAG: type IX secretion system membrane protein PorP/SprF [Elusimicrobia bacterium]|nr:type IX secretion system membrane protein PorP/SprF [Elusimicrobiota bacterium]
MERKLSAVAIVAALSALSPRPAARAAYEDVGVSARVVGMGNAFTAVADDVYAVYYNPAGLALLDRPELAVSYAKLMTGLSDNSNLQNSFLAYERPVKAGPGGTAGLALNYFSLDSLYRELSFYGSYGRRLWDDRWPDTFFGGLSLNILNRSLSSVAVAENALGPTGAALGQADPALQKTSKTNLDADLGGLWRPRPRWTLGLMAQHVLEPDVAFYDGDSDKLGRTVKLGAAYRTPFSTLALDLDFPKAPDGSLDKSAAFALEKWVPTLLHGTFGLRGSLAVGTRDYRQLGLGLSYKIFRMQVDYGFTIPLGGLATSGSHRLGLTYRFGQTRAPQPTISEAMLENIRELAEAGTPEFRYQMEELSLYKRTAMEEFARRAKIDAGSGRFADAMGKLVELVALKPGDAKIAESLARVKDVSDFYPEVRDFYVEPGQAAIYDAALNFIGGRDQEALGNLAYAQGLNPGDARVEGFIKAVEARSGLSRPQPKAPAVAVSSEAAPAQAVTAVSTPAAVVAISSEAAPSAAVVAVSTPAPVVAVSSEAAPAAPADRTRRLVEGYLALMEAAFRQPDYEKVIQLAGQVTDLDETNVLAYKRLGAAAHALKRYPEALSALESAYRHERDAQARRTLRSYINALASFIKRGSTVASQPARPQPVALGPRDIERLYEAGVDSYSRGLLSEAAESFRRILETDPGNVSARRALRRVEAELIQSGDRR